MGESWAGVKAVHMVAGGVPLLLLASTRCCYLLVILSFLVFFYLKNFSSGLFSLPTHPCPCWTAIDFTGIFLNRSRPPLHCTSPAEPPPSFTAISNAIRRVVTTSYVTPCSVLFCSPRRARPLRSIAWTSVPWWRTPCCTRRSSRDV